MIISLLLVALLVLILLLPYEWGYTTDRRGRSGFWRSALYEYRYGPGFERLTFDGLRRLQLWLLLVATAVVGRVQPDLIAWLVETIRLALGL